MLRNPINKKKQSLEIDIPEIDKNFLFQVKITHVPNWNPELVEIDFKECDRLLAEGANINRRFGKHGMNDHNDGSFCGPNDTPLTHAIKREHIELTKYLLNRGADTEVINGSGHTPLLDTRFNNSITKLLLDHGANPNAKDRQNLTAMHMIFLDFREWLIDTQIKPATEAANLLLDAGFVGDKEEILSVLKEIGYNTNDKFVTAFRKICDDVNMVSRLEANKKEYDELKRYIDKHHIQSEKGLSNRINNILRDQEAVKRLEAEREVERLEKEKYKEEKQLNKVTKTINLFHEILEEHTKAINKKAKESPDQKVATIDSNVLSDKNNDLLEKKPILSMIYNPTIPFYKQAIALKSNGGNFNLLGIPCTNIAIYFTPLTINGNEYYIYLNKKTEIGSHAGAYIYNNLSFDVIDVATKKMISNIDPKDIDSILCNLHDQSKDLSLQHKTS